MALTFPRLAALDVPFLSQPFDFAQGKFRERKGTGGW
jgi:hypothetical protein